MEHPEKTITAVQVQNISKGSTATSCRYAGRTLCFLLSAVLLLSTAVAWIPAAAESASTDLETLFFFGTAYCGTIDGKGLEVYNIKYMTSDLIECKPGDLITMGPMYDGQEMYLINYKGTRNMTSRVIRWSDLKIKGNLSDGGKIVEYTVPSDVYYVRSVCKSEVYNTFMITVNRPFTVPEYKSWIEKNGLGSYLEFLAKSKVKFKNKTLLGVGDSVGHGSYEKHYPGAERGGINSKVTAPAFTGRVANILRFSDYRNASRGGATFSTKMANNNISTQLKNYAAKYDYIMIEGGVVDTAGYAKKVVPIGYISNAYVEDYFAGPETMLGGLERSLLEATKNAKEGAVITLVIPYNGVANKNCAGDYFRNYQYYYLLAEKWGVGVIDLWINEAVNETMAYDPSANGLWFYDNLHCTPMGYTICALEIAKQMIDMEPYDIKNRHMPILPSHITKSGSVEFSPGNPPVDISFPENLYSSKTASQGAPWIDHPTQMINKDQYVTSDYVKVSKGDAVYFGPVSVYEEMLMLGYDADKKLVTKTALISSDCEGVVGVMGTGLSVMKFIVPEGIEYLKIVFFNTVAPVITINRPFERSWYNEALKAALYLKPVTAPETGNVDPWTAESVREAMSKAAQPEETTGPEETDPLDPETETAAPDTDAETRDDKKGCRSSAPAAAAVVCLLATSGCLIVRKKRI